MTPLELFFDLVYVFAIGQLSHHPRGALRCPGGGSGTLVLALAVIHAWYMTAWLSNWLSPEHRPVQALLLAIMLASLLMSSAIGDAFDDRAWLFVVPYVVDPGRPRGLRHRDVHQRVQPAHPLRERPRLGDRHERAVGRRRGGRRATRASSCGRQRPVVTPTSAWRVYHPIPGRPSDPLPPRRSGRTPAECTATSPASTCSSGCASSSSSHSGETLITTGSRVRRRARLAPPRSRRS